MIGQGSGGLHWAAIGRDLDAFGCAVAPRLLNAEACRAIADLYPDDWVFRLRQHVCGALVCPLQVAIFLSAPGRDFSGAEFVLTEQRPRMQSRAEVVDLGQGDGVIFAVRERPVQGSRGTYRVAMRHGVSRIGSGERFTFGIVLHDAAWLTRASRAAGRCVAALAPLGHCRAPAAGLARSDRSRTP